LSAIRRKKLIRQAQSLGYIIIPRQKQYNTKPPKGHKFLIKQAARKEETKKLVKKMPKQIQDLHEKERKRRNVYKPKRGWEMLVPPPGLPNAAHRKYKPNTSWVKKRRQFGP